MRTAAKFTAVGFLIGTVFLGGVSPSLAYAATSACPADFHLSTDGTQCNSDISNSVAPFAPATCPTGSTLSNQSAAGVYCVDSQGNPVEPTGTPQQKTTPIVEACQDPGASGYITCALAELVINIFAGLITVATTLLDWADAAFNLAIQNTIVDFATWFNLVQSAVASTWQIFRDLANILIIGFFVFIAISIILGLHEYGQKKMIARVLIVATLINFSFLFTTVVISASNFMATQIYNTIPNVSTQGNGGNNTAAVGIGDRFMTYMGVKTYIDTGNTLMRQYNSANGFAGVIGTFFFSALFALLATGVLLYGAFLLIGRFVILILLLALSAIAFASYLAPTFAESGWSRWWHELLRNAFFAPILMVFIIASLKIAEALSAQGVIGQGARLGNFVSNPKDVSAWQLAFSYFFILGILFLGMYISSQLAAGSARRFAAAGITWPMAGASRLIAAPLGRRLFGRNADIQAGIFGKKADAESARLAGLNREPTRAELSNLAGIIRAKDKASDRSKRTFDFMNTGAGQRFGKMFGMPDALSKATKDNYAETAHKQAEEAAKKAVATAVGKNDAKKIAEEVHRAAGDQIRGEHEDARATLKTAREAAQAAKNAGQLEEQLSAHRQAESQSILKKERAEQAASAPGLTVQQRQARANEIAAETQNIQNARNAAAPLARRIKEIDSTTRGAQQRFEQTQKNLKEHDQQVEETAKSVQAKSIRMAQDVAENLTGSKYSQALRGVGIETDSNAVHHARKLVEKKAPVKDDVARKRLIDSGAKDDSHSAPAAPAASGGAAPGH